MNLNKNNSAFIDFICSEKGQQILNSNSLSVHIKTGKTFYNNFNNSECFLDFLLAQQNETKKNYQKKISYSHSFEKYIKSFFQELDFDETDKCDLHINKNAKYVFYRYNSYLESTPENKQIIRQTKKLKIKSVLKKLKIKIGNI